MQQHDKDLDKSTKNVRINWQRFKGRILIHNTVGTAAVYNEL